MKALSILLILAGSLTLTACDEAQKPVKKFTANQLAERKARETLRKAKEVEQLLQETTKKRMKKLEGLD